MNINIKKKIPTPNKRGQKKGKKQNIAWWINTKQSFVGDASFYFVLWPLHIITVFNTISCFSSNNWKLQVILWEQPFRLTWRPQVACIQMATAAQTAKTNLTYHSQKEVILKCPILTLLWERSFSFPGSTPVCPGTF